MQHGPYEHKLQRQTSIYIKGKFSGKNSTTASRPAMSDGLRIAWPQQTRTGYVWCRSVLCAKSYKKIRKNLGLIPLRKKNWQQQQRRLCNVLSPELCRSRNIASTSVRGFWPQIRDRVCGQMLSQICCQSANLRFAFWPDLHTGPSRSAVCPIHLSIAGSLKYN